MARDIEPSGGELKRRIQEFARRATVEISTADEGLLPALAQRLPPGMTVYIAPRGAGTLEDVIRVASSAQLHGFRASPHLIARRLVGERALHEALRELVDVGVEQILLVAGEESTPAGKFASVADVLATGATVQEGIRCVGVAGYPEGHRTIGPSKLLQALRAKQAFAASTGTRVHLVTQFGFDTAALGAWASSLQRAGISLPIHVGIAGPMPLPQLIQLAMQYSPRGSLATLMTHLTAMSHQARPTTAPDEVLSALVRECDREGLGHIQRPHLYSFGRAVATASWLRRVMDGLFDFSDAADSFSLP